MEAKKILEVYNLEGKPVSQIELDPEVFDGKVNEALLYQVINMYLANKRKGTASTKTRGEVSGGGKKPWRQKGTGRARHGSIRSPLWRGGGVVFGPHPRDYHYKVPHKMKISALKSVLNIRLKENNLKIVDVLSLNDHKTKSLLSVLFNLGLYKKKEKPIKTIMLLDKKDQNIERAGRNLNFLKIILAKDVNALDLLNYQMALFSVSSLKQLIERLKN